jgi:hypothetical protein
MGYRLLATAIVVVHFAFVGYVVFGGFLAWRWTWTMVPHALAAAWGALVITLSLDCPLTAAQNWARRRGGEPELSGGFIDRYLTGVLYPARYLHEVQALAVAVVLVSWLGLLLRLRPGRRQGSPRSGRLGGRWSRGRTR